MGVSMRAGRHTRVYVPFWLLLVLSPFIATIYLTWAAVRLLAWIVMAIADYSRSARG